VAAVIILRGEIDAQAGIAGAIAVVSRAEGGSAVAMQQEQEH
jgi:hypothetical protein